jgi:hypothetical protein
VHGLALLQRRARGAEDRARWCADRRRSRTARAPLRREAGLEQDAAAVERGQQVDDAAAEDRRSDEESTFVYEVALDEAEEEVFAAVGLQQRLETRGEVTRVLLYARGATRSTSSVASGPGSAARPDRRGSVVGP